MADETLTPFTSYADSVFKGEKNAVQAAATMRQSGFGMDQAQGEYQARGVWAVAAALAALVDTLRERLPL